ncbi:uncharacterized protein PG986_002963 [Apiospora aurea]|uniref:Uncharacterized protein n=1 Tax=Apiospora aurea TaxID=335848 RepID=A0ABR1QQB3_9PEZI
MLWQKVAFMMGLIPSVALAAGIAISSSSSAAGGLVALPQSDSDTGPAVTTLEATFTVPNLTYASGQSGNGDPYRLAVQCGISALTDANPNAACNNRGPHMGIFANLSSAGQTQQGWYNWPALSVEGLSSAQDSLLNFTAGDAMFVTISLLSATNATYTFMNLKNENVTVTVAQDGNTSPMCSGKGTTAYAGCYISVTDASTMPGFAEIDFESVMVYDRGNTTHDFGLDQTVQFWQLIDGNGKLKAMPELDDAYDFSVKWSENPDYGSGTGGAGTPPPPDTFALRW